LFAYAKYHHAGFSLEQLQVDLSLKMVLLEFFAKVLSSKNDMDGQGREKGR
jgi:hypothetical protein